MPLSAKQMEYLALAWQCFESEPKINYAKFATVAGLASAASARELMRVTKNKLKDEYGALSTTLQTSNNTPTTPQPRTPKRKLATAGTRTATPAPKKKERKALVAVAETGGVEGEDGGEDGEAGDVAVHVEKKARTTKAKAAVTLAPDAAAAADGVDGVKVKSEFVPEEVLAEEEVSIF